MGEMASLWGYGENHDMEQLGQKLLCTTLELEKLKSEAMEEMKKNKEYVKQLIHLLKFAIQERDEARNQFQKLLNKTLPLTTPSADDGGGFPSVHLFQSDSPLLKPAKANSSITESNSLPEPYNYHSHGSSLGFDAVVGSPEFFVQESTAVDSPVVPKLDRDALVIENIAKGRVLPQKGKFLQAVLQAGPLLQTVIVAGPLPRWRNPPQFQPFQMPPVPMGEGDVFSYKPLSNVGQLSARPMNLNTYGQSSCGSTQVQTSPMLNFGNLASANCLSNASLMNTNGYNRLAKRQRFC